MLVVKIELHSAVTGEIKTVATGTTCNTGTGSPTQGNYRIDLRDGIPFAVERRSGGERKVA